MKISGATIGHRELMRYYRQRLKPEGSETRNQKRARDAVQKVMGQYKALGWTGTTGLSIFLFTHLAASNS